MGRTVFIDDDKIWIDYYESQARQYGHGFQGIPYQRGHGLGSFLGRLFRTILPVVKNVGKSALRNVGQEALHMGANVIGDLSEGRDVGDSLKEHSLKATKNLINRAQDSLSKQSGKGLGKRPAKSVTTTLPKKKKRRGRKPKSDYFS